MKQQNTQPKAQFHETLYGSRGNMTFAKGRADKTREEFDSIHDRHNQSQTLVFSSLSTFLGRRDRDNNVGTILSLNVDSTGNDSRLYVLVGSSTKDGTRARGVTGIRAARANTVHVTCIDGAHNMGHCAVIPTKFSTIGTRKTRRDLHDQCFFKKEL